MFAWSQSYRLELSKCSEQLTMLVYKLFQIVKLSNKNKSQNITLYLLAFNKARFPYIVYLKCNCNIRSYKAFSQGICTINGRSRYENIKDDVMKHKRQSYKQLFLLEMHLGGICSEIEQTLQILSPHHVWSQAIGTSVRMGMHKHGCPKNDKREIRMSSTTSTTNY